MEKIGICLKDKKFVCEMINNLNFPAFRVSL